MANKNGHGHVKRYGSSQDKKQYGHSHDIKCLKIIIGIMIDNILPKLSWVVTNFYEIHTISKILLLIMLTHVNITWGRLRHPFLCDNAFLCNSTYQINQISLESLFLNVREKIL